MLDNTPHSPATLAALSQIEVAQKALETIHTVIDKFGVETYAVLMRELSVAPVAPRRR